MLNTTTPRTAERTMRNAPKQDLRAWLAQMQEAGELVTVTGADRDEEIGGIVDIYQRTMGAPAVMFQDIPGFPPRHRVVANILTSVRRINLTLGMPAETSEMDLVRHWRNYMKNPEVIPPVTVESGPLMENVATGTDVDILKIPTPKWHEHDGGRYIGTGCMVIMRHPDTGWINYGAYRIQVQDSNVASIMTSKGKHGNLIMRRWHELGKPCPIAVVCGRHRGPIRQERVRCRWSAARGAGRGDPRPQDRPADPGPRGDCLRGLRASGR